MNQPLWDSIANTFGTPAYVYDGECMVRQFALLKDCLPESFDIFFSVKSNPLLGICELLKQQGACVEVASAGELYLALQAGFPPQDIIFTSPGKSQEDLEYALNTGIFSINVESLRELYLIHQLAAKRGQIAHVSLRINPSFQHNGAGLKMSGVPSQFGIDQDQLGGVFEELEDMPYIHLRGIHVFFGSQILDSGHLLRNVQSILELAVQLMDTNRMEFDFIDIGGGFGVPYFKGETELQTDVLKSGLMEIWKGYSERLSGVRVGVESGRFLLAEAGSFLTKVLYVKESKGATYYVCDGGSNHHASSAFLGRYVRNNFPMHLPGMKGELSEVHVVGSLCTPTDVLGQKVMLPKAEPGDLLVIEKSGAYGLTHSPVLFLSHALPPEILVYEGELIVLRERGQNSDVLRGQHSLHSIKLAEARGS
ncbi:type III PLP-dependent enzyme [Paenibacillus hexagrammi]|uniref:Type III PLP-dependent enzyme n=1 Tax=Paenibacillus hexagrammi TaxID=2908839 RepID=A0ABY3SD49_9BACL|nr:type III PLP-dependent enzyme [Paenibacillus sp. YPD9-1]UJF31348.1 type III PLP-dependent enzyme [Paenibacillus sp. YPD9-1]